MGVLEEEERKKKKEGRRIYTHPELRSALALMPARKHCEVMGPIVSAFGPEDYKTILNEVAAGCNVMFGQATLTC